MQEMMGAHLDKEKLIEIHWGFLDRQTAWGSRNSLKWK